MPSGPIPFSHRRFPMVRRQRRDWQLQIRKYPDEGDAER
jgi:hypothetical protein